MITNFSQNWLPEQKRSRTVKNEILSKLAPGPLITNFSQNWLPDPRRSPTVNNTPLTKLAPGVKNGPGPLITFFFESWLPEPKRCWTVSNKNLEEPAPGAKPNMCNKQKAVPKMTEKVWAPRAERTRTANKTTK